MEDCKVKIQVVRIEMPHLNKENKDLKEKVMQLEQYKGHRNLKIHDLEEKDKHI